MQWPTPQDYNETVQSPDFCFDNQELQQGAPEVNAMGLPKPICGNFASVYQFQCATRSVAVKCFLRNVYNQHQRYGHLSQFMQFNHVATLLDFEYLLKGILVDGNWFPIVKMPWVEGHTLDQFIRKNMHNRQQLDRFNAQFTDLVLELERSGIAHGDLQHGNIIVRNKDVMLVDYDGIYVPAMAGEQANELGHVNYQHPERSAENFDATIDRFSAWIIHHTMFFLRLDPTLWQRHAGGEEALLFTSSDYKDPSNSRLLSELTRHPIPEIQKRAEEVRKLLALPLNQIPAFRPEGANLSTLNQTAIVVSNAGKTTQELANPNLTGKGNQPRTPATNAEEQAYKPARFPHIKTIKDTIIRDSNCFSDPVLREGRIIEGDQFEGKNGFVVRVAGKEKHFAVKYFLRDSPDRKQRYEAIAKHNMKDAGKYLVSFQYQSKGLQIDQQWLPILRMGYIDGKRIDDYVRFQLRSENKAEIQRIIRLFRDMMLALNSAGIAHGDLEPSNILVDSRGNLRLVDYDAMYVPAIAHMQSAEVGSPMFQHPTRTLGHFGPYLDNFPALVIDSVLSCMALAPHENLWNWETFIQQLRPSNSWKAGGSQQDATQRAGKLIREMQKYRIDQVPSLKASH